MALRLTWSVLRRLRIVLLFPLVGCLTIEEHYRFHKDGSGRMEFVVDMSPVAELLGALGELTSGGSNTHHHSLEQHASALRDVQGVHAVRLRQEKKGFVQRLQFGFADADALDRALNVLLPDSTGVPHRQFAWHGDTLVRSNGRLERILAEDLFGGREAEQADSADNEVPPAPVKYIYTFRLSEPVVDVQAGVGAVVEMKGRRRISVTTSGTADLGPSGMLDLHIALKP
jgi:hypothetical protein